MARTKFYLYRFFDAADGLLYVGISIRAYERFSQHQTSSAWFPEAVKVTFELLPDMDELREAETRAIRDERPRYNVSQNERTREEESEIFARALAGMPSDIVFSKKHGGRFVQVKERRDVHRRWHHTRAMILSRLMGRVDLLVGDLDFQAEHYGKLLAVLRDVERSNPFSPEREEQLERAITVLDEDLNRWYTEREMEKTHG